MHNVTENRREGKKTHKRANVNHNQNEEARPTLPALYHCCFIRLCVYVEALKLFGWSIAGHEIYTMLWYIREMKRF